MGVGDESALGVRRFPEEVTFQLRFKEIHQRVAG